jgi:hypothetical protein
MKWGGAASLMLVLCMLTRLEAIAGEPDLLAADGVFTCMPAMKAASFVIARCMH